MIHIATDGLAYFAAILIIGIAFTFPSITVGTTFAGVIAMLLLLCLGDYLVFREAYIRMITPHEVLGIPTLLAAIAGLLLNIVVLSISRRTPVHEQNLRHASIDAHAVSDIAVSIAVILTAAIISFTDWGAIDWIVAFGVGVYLFFGPILSLVKRIWNSYTLADIISPHAHDHAGHDHDHEHEEDDDEHEHNDYTPSYYRPPKSWYEMSEAERLEQNRWQESSQKGHLKHRRTKPNKKIFKKQR